MRITLTHNPKSGDELPADDLRALLEAEDYEIAYVSTKKRRKLERALQDPGEFVVVAGGDGTVAKVARKLAGRGVPLAILPFGTANNIAKSIGVLGPTRQLIAGWRTATRRPFDVGTVVSPRGGRRFVESVGCGVFAQLVARGQSEVDDNPLEFTGNEIDRALLLLRHILESSSVRRVELELDGDDLSGDYLLVEAMNIRHAGPNVPLAPDAVQGDGLLDVVAVTEDDRTPLLRYIAGRLAGSGEVPALPVRRGRRLVMAYAATAVHVDDDIWPEIADDAEEESVVRRANGEPPGVLQIELERGALEVLVSAPAGTFP